MENVGGTQAKQPQSRSQRDWDTARYMDRAADLLRCGRLAAAREAANQIPIEQMRLRVHEDIGMASLIFYLDATMFALGVMGTISTSLIWGIPNAAHKRTIPDLTWIVSLHLGVVSLFHSYVAIQDVDRRVHNLEVIARDYGRKASKCAEKKLE